MVKKHKDTHGFRSRFFEALNLQVSIPHVNTPSPLGHPRMDASWLVHVGHTEIPLRCIVKLNGGTRKKEYCITLEYHLKNGTVSLVVIRCRNHGPLLFMFFRPSGVCPQVQTSRTYCCFFFNFRPAHTCFNLQSPTRQMLECR